MSLKYYFLTVFFLCISVNNQAQVVKIKELQINKLKNISVRAIEVINDSTVWFAGSNGKFGRIINDNIEVDSITFQNKALNFRSIAFNGKYIFILSIENPAILYKIDPFKGKLATPQIVYTEFHKNVFYDSLNFFDDLHGIAIGDPTENCLSIILTKDGGNTWKKLNCNKIPDIVNGEAAFAASNTNIATYKKYAWIATGGKKSRVFISNNCGLDWKVVNTPITQGGKMTGIYSVDFYDKNNGIIMGGDWENKKNYLATKAITNNGGKAWKLIADGELPGYISCVQYIPKSKGKKIIALSTAGIYFSDNQGEKWVKISTQDYYSIRFIDNHTAWLSGNNKIAKINLQYN